MTSPFAYITFWRRMRAIAPKLDWREELVCKCRTNETSMMMVLIDGGGVAVTSDSRGFMSVALWVFCIVPSTWLRESGTGVSEYLRTSAMSIFCCNEWYRIHPNRSRTKQAATTLSGFFSVCVYLLQMQMWADFVEVFSSQIGLDLQCTTHIWIFLIVNSNFSLLSDAASPVPIL